MGITHTKTLAVPDNGNAAQVQSADWNAAHALTGMLQKLDALTPAASKVLCLDAAGNGELLPKSSILTAVSPALTGNPTAPTDAQGTNDDSIATCAFVVAAINALIASALNGDPNFDATVLAAIALKAPLASPALTGTPTAPTQSADNNTTRIATTAYVDTLKVTQALGDNTTKFATTAFVQAAIRNGSVVGSSLTTDATNADLTTLVPIDDTVPTSSEGTSVISASYTPISTTNKLRITFTGQVSPAASDNIVASIFQGTTNIGAQLINVSAVNIKGIFSFVAEYTPGALTSQSISVRVGGGTQTVRMNGTTSGRLLGGNSKSTLLIEEIKA